MLPVTITSSAQADLKSIYYYHRDYSLEYARTYQIELVAFLDDQLSRNPFMGTAYNESKAIRRFVYDGRFNIYYLIKDDTVFILFILDGRHSYNMRLLDSDVELPPLG